MNTEILNKHIALCGSWWTLPELAQLLSVATDSVYGPNTWCEWTPSVCAFLEEVSTAIVHLSSLVQQPSDYTFARWTTGCAKWLEYESGSLVWDCEAQDNIAWDAREVSTCADKLIGYLHGIPQTFDRR